MPKGTRETGKDEPKDSEELKFQLFSPTDYRYGVEELTKFLSEEAYVRYKARIEVALAEQFAREGICSDSVAEEIKKAANIVNASEVYEEERRIKHDIRALVNVIASRVSEKARPFVHLAATSYDIVDSANALRFKDAINQVILPDLRSLESVLIELALKYSKTPQIGRTHGQHAEPITFGFFLSYYVSRLGRRILKIKEASDLLTGKFAGAVGVYGPLSLIVDDPESFEKDLLASIGLESSEVSTQIVQPEPMTDLIHAFVSTFGVLANLSRDLRHLQRSEILEVAESFGKEQVGSSTMPHKRNPIDFENVESMWKKFMPQMITVYLDQVSEHQRDLTNSSSQRYLPELLVAFDYSVRRLTRALWDSIEDAPKLIVDEENLRRNLQSSGDKILAEPLYILLALAGHPSAHEAVRKAVQASVDSKTRFYESMQRDKDLAPYLEKIKNPLAKKVLKNPSNYTGIAAEKARRTALAWKKKLLK